MKCLLPPLSLLLLLSVATLAGFQAGGPPTTKPKAEDNKLAFAGHRATDGLTKNKNDDSESASAPDESQNSIPHAAANAAVPGCQHGAAWHNSNRFPDGIGLMLWCRC